jgi:hypothetical protein
LLFLIQKVVEFLNQFHELVVILFFGNMLAQDVHALSFIRGHGILRETAERNTYLRRMTNVNR